MATKKKSCKKVYMCGI